MIEFKPGDKVMYVRTAGFSIWNHDGPPEYPTTNCFVGTLQRIVTTVSMDNTIDQARRWSVLLEDNNIRDEVWESELIPIPENASENQIKALKGLFKVNYD